MLFRKAETLGELLAEIAIAGQQQVCEAEICITGIFKSDAVLMRAEREIGEFCQFPIAIACTLGTGKLRQLECFIASVGYLAEKWRQPVEGGAHSVDEWSLEPFANGVPIRCVAQHKLVHPSIALAKHLG